MEYASIRVDRDTADRIRNEADKRGIAILELMRQVVSAFEGGDAQNDVHAEMTDEQKDALRKAKKSSYTTTVHVNLYTSVALDILAENMNLKHRKYRILDDLVRAKLREWYSVNKEGGQ